MYTTTPPTPLIIDLNGKNNLDIRIKANDYVEDNWEEKFSKLAKSKMQTVEKKKLDIKRGMLAQMAIRRELGLPEIEPEEIQLNEALGGLASDLTNPNGVIMDVKMENITIDFQEEYDGSGGIPRQAKHNFFPRQLYDPKLAKTDLFIVTRLRSGDTFPGSGRANEKKWKLWVCGWVSKKRVISEGVLIPRGGITEQGQRFFDYRSHNVEFYQYALNGMTDLKQWYNDIEKDDVVKDEEKNPQVTPQCTTADRQRIIGSLLVRGIISDEQFQKINESLGLDGKFVPPILHENHTISYVKHLVHDGKLPNSILETLEKAGITETLPQDLPELNRFFSDSDG